MEEPVEKILNTNYLNISPISKGRRVLLSLADTLITYILSVLLFTVMVYPIARAISSSEDKSTTITTTQHRMMDLLYENHLLSYEEGKDKYSYDEALSYSGDQMARSMLDKDETNLYPITYFVTMKKETREWVYAKVKALDKDHLLEENSLSFTSTYEEEFYPLIDTDDSFSKQGEEDYRNYKNHLFASIYSWILEDLQSNSSAIPEYQTLYQKVEALSKENDNTILVAAILAYVLSTLICYLLIPLVNEKGSTLGMIFMRVTRLEKTRFYPLNRGRRMIASLLSFLFSMVGLLFIPITAVSIGHLFSFQLLFYLSLASLVLNLVSLCFILFGRLAGSLGDIATGSVIVDNDTYDQLMRARISK